MWDYDKFWAKIGVRIINSIKFCKFIKFWHWGVIPGVSAFYSYPGTINIVFRNNWIFKTHSWLKTTLRIRLCKKKLINESLWRDFALGPERGCHYPVTLTQPSFQSSAIRHAKCPIFLGEIELKCSVGILARRFCEVTFTEFQMSDFKCKIRYARKHSLGWKLKMIEI